MKRAILITDISALGNCSGSVGISVLSALSVEPCFLPTAVLSAQTGFKEHVVFDLTPQLDALSKSLMTIDPPINAVCVGFVTNESQLDIAAAVFEHFRKKGAVVVVDPICGDNGKRFEFLSDAAFERLSKLALSADIITPNITELCLLARGDYESLASLDEREMLKTIVSMCLDIMNDQLKTVVVTGIDCGGEILNLVVENEYVTEIRAKRYGGSMSGTGDIMTACITAAAAKGESVGSACKKAADFISTVMKSADSTVDRNYGIPYQSHIEILSQQ